MKNNPHIAELITELGGPTEVGFICGLAQSSVSCWISRGLPRHWYRYLKLKYPHLKAWKAFESDALQNNKDS